MNGPRVLRVTKYEVICGQISCLQCYKYPVYKDRARDEEIVSKLYNLLNGTYAGHFLVTRISILQTLLCFLFEPLC